MTKHAFTSGRKLRHLKLRATSEYRYEYRYQNGDVGKVIRVTVHYMKTASLSRRGIWMDLTLWTIENDSESTILTDLLSSPQVLVERLARSSPRALLAVCERADEHVPVFAEIMAIEGKERAQEALKAFFEAGTVPTLLWAAGSEIFIND